MTSETIIKLVISDGCSMFMKLKFTIALSSGTSSIDAVRQKHVYFFCEVHPPWGPTCIEFMRKFLKNFIAPIELKMSDASNKNFYISKTKCLSAVRRSSVAQKTRDSN